MRSSAPILALIAISLTCCMTGIAHAADTLPNRETELTDHDTEPAAVDEFDIHGLEHGKKDLILPSGDNNSGYIWYRHPINIVVLCVASSVLLMIIVSGLYAFKSCTADAKHAKRHSQ